MLFPSLVALGSLVLPALAQQTPIRYDVAHNATPIVGTWATGSRQVQTGPGFAQPANLSFIYPKVAGESYAFSDDGYYELSRFRFNSNATQPNCITGVLVWAHGKYELLPNGSIVLSPFGDGYQQVQDACAAESSFIQDYNETELFQSWRIFRDVQQNQFKLHLFKFDGSPVAPQFQVYSTPNMLPTRMLRNVTPPLDFVGQEHFVKNAGSRGWSPAGVTGLVSSVFAAALGSLFL